jgi:hypothetical protein
MSASMMNSMNNSTNANLIPLILAQLTDLQMRVTAQESVINSLKQDIIYLSSKSAAHTTALSGRDMSLSAAAAPFTPIKGKSTMNTSIPLKSHSGYKTHDNPSSLGAPKKRPQVGKPFVASVAPMPQFSVSDLLNEGEEVIFEIKLSRDDTTNVTCKAQYSDGGFTITGAEHVGDFVGQTFDKAGAILFKYIEMLQAKGLYKWATVKIKPWRLGHVVRDGNIITLEQLAGNKASN